MLPPFKRSDASSRLVGPTKMILKAYKCSNCGKEVLKKPSEAAKTERKGGRLYCSRKCSNSGRTVSEAHKAKTRASLYKHYGTGPKPPKVRKPGRTREEYNAHMREVMRKRHTERMSLAIESLGGKCVKCGNTEKLELDHIDTSTKSFTLSQGWPSSERFWQEVKKCQLLCRSCHEEKTIKDLGQERAKGKHGTLSSYTYCRCELCKKAKSEYYREYRKRRKQVLKESEGS